MTTVVLFENGGWNWLEHTSVMELGSQKHVEINIGENWSDRDVSDMLSEYYETNRFLLFESDQ